MKPALATSILFLALSSITLTCHATDEINRAILLNPIIGDQAQTVKLLITEGSAKDCQAQGIVTLNKKRLRYEFALEPINCIKNGQSIKVGQVVRGQHNILGTMANSGMGRKFLVSNKGVTVTLAQE